MMKQEIENKEVTGNKIHQAMEKKNNEDEWQPKLN